MIYVFEGGSVVYDGTTISEAQKSQAVAVEGLPPMPEIPAGKMAVLRADKATETVSWELVDKPVSDEDRLDLLEQAIAELTIFIAGGIA